MKTILFNNNCHAPSLMVTLTTITGDSFIQAMYSYSASVIRLFNKQVVEFEPLAISTIQNKKAPVFNHPNCTFPEYIQQRLHVSQALGHQITWPDLTVRFTVTRSGKINNIKSTGATKEMREEAERIIKNSENIWIPAMQNEATVDYVITQKVFFRFV
jgi:hypothetical protein